MGARADRRGLRRRAAGAAGALAALAALACTSGVVGTTSAGGGAPASHTAAGATGSLRLLVEPRDGLRPIDALIASAHRSVDMVMYELEDPVAERALAADAARGAHVRVVLDRRYEERANEPAAAYLEAHGVAVRWSSSRFDLTHEKSLVVDGRLGVVMTLNLTARYYATSRDFAVVDTRPVDVSAMTAVFDADWTGDKASPPTGTDLLWSPGAEAPVLSMIASARASILVEDEEMADPLVTSALAAASRRGVRVEVVMTDRAEWAGAFDQLARSGVRTRTYPDTATGLYVHAKVLVIDPGSRDARVLVGSQNFSYPSLAFNRELGVVTAATAIVDGVASVVEHDFAGGTPWRASIALG